MKSLLLNNLKKLANLLKLIIVCKRPVLIIFLVALFLLANCARRYPRPVLNYDDANWFDIARVTEQNFSRLQTMQGQALLSFEIPNFSRSISAEILLKRPDSLRIKVEAIFGIDVALLIADRDSVRIYSPFEKVLYVAPTDSLNFNRFFSVKMDYEELLGAITGIEHISDSCKIQRKDGKLICYIAVETGVIVSYVDPVLGVVTRAEELNKNGQIVQRREYDRFERKNGVIIPKTIRVTRPRDTQRVTIFYSDLVVNRKLNQKDFEMQIPGNISRVSLPGW